MRIISARADGIHGPSAIVASGPALLDSDQEFDIRVKSEQWNAGASSSMWLISQTFSGGAINIRMPLDVENQADVLSRKLVTVKRHGYEGPSYPKIFPKGSINCAIVRSSLTLSGPRWSFAPKVSARATDLEWLAVLK